jgi:glycosyltransferase involved in cell wall biosynthesis
MTKNIGMICPQYYSLPKTGYASIGTIVSEITKGLLELGNRVHLFAPGTGDMHQYLSGFLHADDLQRLEVHRLSGFDYGTKENLERASSTPQEYASRISDRISQLDLDVIHTHNSIVFDFLDLDVPITHTINTARSMQNPDTIGLFRKYSRSINFLGASESLRSSYPGVIRGVVYNGEDPKIFAKSDRGKNPGPGGVSNYMVFIGEIAKHKGVKTCIESCLSADKNIVVIGSTSIFDPDEDYLEELQGMQKRYPDRISLVGQKNDAEKVEYLSHAKGLIFASGTEDPTWEEPFGLVLIEAGFSGVPVIAVNNGAVPEIIVDEETGFIVPMEPVRQGDLSQIVDAINKADQINPQNCIDHTTKKFSHTAIAEEYLRKYNW